MSHLIPKNKLGKEEITHVVSTLLEKSSLDIELPRSSSSIRDRLQRAGQLWKTFKTDIATAHSRKQASVAVESKTTVPIPAQDPFDGWWQCLTKGDLFGFGLSFSLTDDRDSYIRINANNAEFPTIYSLAGTVDYPREPNPSLSDSSLLALDDPVEGIQATFFRQSSTELVSTFSFGGPDFFAPNGPSYWSLRLQSDGQTMVAVSDTYPDLVGYEVTPLLFRKILAPPVPVRPVGPSIGEIFPDPNDPVNIAKYYFDAMLYQYCVQENVHFHDTDYIGFSKTKEIIARLLSPEGITVTTPIRRLRVTVPGPHYDPGGIGPMTTEDRLTDVFTEGFSYCVGGSTVKICGFKGNWKPLNGTYVNGVAVIEEGAPPNPHPAFVDVGNNTIYAEQCIQVQVYGNPIDPLPDIISGSTDKVKIKFSKHEKKHHKIHKPGKHGTWENVNNKFMLRFDSSDPLKFPRDNIGYAVGIHDCDAEPRVTVTHRIAPDTEFPAMWAALRAFFFLTLRVSTHCWHDGYFPRNSVFLFDTWDILKTAVANNDFWGVNGPPELPRIRTRTNQMVPSGFYQNATLTGPLERRGITTYNDPFGLSMQPGSISDYNISLANYMQAGTIRNVYWALQGTPTGPLQFDPHALGIPGYKALIPGPLPVEFVATLGVLNVVDGKPVPLNPDPTHYNIVRSGANLIRVANGYYAALIDPKWLPPALKNKHIGYLHWVDTFYVPDPDLYAVSGIFNPNGVPKTIRNGREALCRVYSELMRYLSTTLDCDAIIFDVQTNEGGYEFTIQTLAEFFGDDRVNANPFQLSVNKDNGYSQPYNLGDSSTFQSVNDVVAQNYAQFEKFYVSLNRQFYPGSVFEGTPTRPRKVVVLTDYAASSGGDILPHYFMGELQDGNLGANVQAVVIGDIDGRNKGAESDENPVPTNGSDSRLINSLGGPFPGFRYFADLSSFGAQPVGLTGKFMNQQFLEVSPVPALLGKAGRAPMPNDWESTVWQDLGYVTPYQATKGFESYPAPTPQNRSSWRNKRLEAAIATILNL